MEVKVMDEKKDLIREYITEEECKCMCDKKTFDCNNCNNFNDCCIEADMRCNDDFNNVFTELIGYGGYDNKDDFWEQLLD